MSSPSFLRQERATLAGLLPGLDEALTGWPLLTLESPGNPALPVFRTHRGPGLLIPRNLGGQEATPLQMVRVQRALGSRSPSLAVATTMHHFAVATLVVMQASESVALAPVLERIARDNLYVASAFAEGNSGTSILSSLLWVEETEMGFFLSGSKKPCSLSGSMDLLTASVQLPAGVDGGRTLALVLLPGDAPGLQRRPFWNTSVLAGAESDELVLERVLVPRARVFLWSGPGVAQAVQQRSILWFELLITASYLGVGSALVERVLAQRKGTPAERVLLASELESAMAALESLALALGDGRQGMEELTRAYLIRIAAQRALDRTTTHAAELLGGTAFMSSTEVACLLASARALAFHPPNRLSIGPALDAYLTEGRFGAE